MLGAIMFIIYQVGRMSIIMYLPCMVLGNLTGISVNLLIVIMGVIAIIYSYTGGLKSVLWTDFIQGSVLLIGVTASLVFLIAHINVLARLQKRSPQAANSLRQISRFLTSICSRTAYS